MNRQWPDDGAESAAWQTEAPYSGSPDATMADNVIVAFKWRASLTAGVSPVSMIELFPDAPPSDFERRSFFRKLPVFLGVLDDMGNMEGHEEYFRRVLLLAWIRRFARVCNSTVPWNTQEISSRLESMWGYREQYGPIGKLEVGDRHHFAGFIVGQFMLMLEQPHNIKLLDYIAFDLIDDWLYHYSYETGCIIQDRDEFRQSPIALKIQRL